ncbi:uncharacterized protein LOC100904310 [Galendromus occidentalis]|uniref:Uncharacterized protein LOC100904310 n=1 Tax=Galendromus occidentalis TaxID=34638 RepID=A0AAJ7L2P6_9ACAR|nr:uncharacterized protein LOC100904310 [Galendromus occidentalis]
MEAPAEQRLAKVSENERRKMEGTSTESHYLRLLKILAPQFQIVQRTLTVRMCRFDETTEKRILEVSEYLYKYFDGDLAETYQAAYKDRAFGKPWEPEQVSAAALEALISHCGTIQTGSEPARDGSTSRAENTSSEVSREQPQVVERRHLAEIPQYDESTEKISADLAELLFEIFPYESNVAEHYQSTHKDRAFGKPWEPVTLSAEALETLISHLGTAQSERLPNDVHEQAPVGEQEHPAQIHRFDESTERRIAEVSRNLFQTFDHFNLAKAYHAWYREGTLRQSWQPRQLTAKELNAVASYAGQVTHGPDDAVLHGMAKSGEGAPSLRSLEETYVSLLGQAPIAFELDQEGILSRLQRDASEREISTGRSGSL